MCLTQEQYVGRPSKGYGCTQLFDKIEDHKSFGLTFFKLTHRYKDTKASLFLAIGRLLARTCLFYDFLDTYSKGRNGQLYSLFYVMTGLTFGDQQY
jgi:hypothetical protein